MALDHANMVTLAAAMVEWSDDPIVTEDDRGTITSWNRAAERTFGYTAVEAVGEPLALIIPDTVADEHDPLGPIGRGEAITATETMRRRKDGSLVRVSLTISAFRSPTGEVVGFTHFMRTLTSPSRSERLARRLAAIVQSSDDAIASKDLNSIVTSWNPAAERMYGYSAAEMIGQSIRIVIPDDRQAEEDHVLEQIGRGQRLDHFETVRKRKDGSLFPISLTVSPILDSTGKVIGASKIARDISERRRQEEERGRLMASVQEEASITEKLNRIGVTVSSTLDRDVIVHAVTETAAELTNADVGAFLATAPEEAGGGRVVVHTVAGAPREDFERFPSPRTTDLFALTLSGERIVRIDDLLSDPGVPAATHQAASGRPSMRSYLAVPVKARSGEVHGGLFLGHSDPGVFTARHERLATGIAAWAALALENARLYVSVQEASRMKDEFLATLSHELRTPLNAILGYARMVRSGLITGPKGQRAVETIERNATSLTQIVEDVLDVARIISGKIRLNVQPLDLRVVVRDAVEAVTPAANARGVRVETVFAPDAASVTADPERLQQVIWNLLSNAVKFTGSGGRVQATVARVGTHVEVSVSDTGIGIVPAFLPYVFERFRQADSGTTREHGGLGLGLSISRHLVEMHGGSIHAASAGEGRGATFRVRLPMMVSRPSSPDVGRAGSGDEERERSIVSIPDLNGVRIFVVDDDPDALLMVTEILEAAGAEVTTASSAAEAVQVLDGVGASTPDVLVSDLAMPHMDGFELIAHVRGHQNAALREMPAAALTAYARSEDRVRALRSGYQLHLAKPIDPGELMRAVAALAGRAASPAPETS